MSAEHGHEILVLASTVNRICDVTQPEEVDGSILIDAQKVIDAFDPVIKISQPPIILSYDAPQNPFGGVMATDVGNVHSQMNSDGERKEISIIKRQEERVGLYKIAKRKDGKHNLVLNLRYFMEEVNTDKRIAHFGDITHILYDKESKKLKALIKSNPKLAFELGNIKVISYDQTQLWGDDKLEDFRETEIIL